MAWPEADTGEPEAGQRAEREDAPVVLPIEDWLDLHPFAPQDVPDIVREYLRACVQQGLREVRLIHGRGTGTQRAIVRSVLAAHPSVLEYADAPPERGGWGATVVHLRGESPPRHQDTKMK